MLSCEVIIKLKCDISESKKPPSVVCGTTVKSGFALGWD
jgi:hypothetical protein